MKSATLVLMLTGLVTVLVGFGYGVTPVESFQGSTPDETWQQTPKNLVSQTIMLVGVTQFVLGSVFGVFVLIAEALRNRKATGNA